MERHLPFHGFGYSITACEKIQTILKTKKWIRYNTGKVIYRKEIYRESKIWEKTY